jgi:hypothetical protein
MPINGEGDFFSCGTRRPPGIEHYKKDRRRLMENRNLTGFAGFLLSFSLLLFLASCASKPDIVGKWREVGKTATLEFSADGAFKAVDNQGMAVSGTYSLFKDGTLKCEIKREGASEEIVHVKISIKGDELMLTGSEGREVERYQRNK